MKISLLLVALTAPVISSASIAATRPDAPELQAERGDRRRFEINFSESLHIAASKFWLTPEGGSSKELDFDRSEAVASKVAVFVPNDRRGKVRLSWTVTPVDGEATEGELSLNLE